MLDYQALSKLWLERGGDWDGFWSLTPGEFRFLMEAAGQKTSFMRADLGDLMTRFPDLSKTEETR